MDRERSSSPIRNFLTPYAIVVMSYVDTSSDIAPVIVMISYMDMSSDVTHVIVVTSYMDTSSDVAHVVMSYSTYYCGYMWRLLSLMSIVSPQPRHITESL
jgi:hypothetical protein